MASGKEYELEDVPATLVVSTKIDETFRSSCIGKWTLSCCLFPYLHHVLLEDDLHMGIRDISFKMTGK